MSEHSDAAQRPGISDYASTLRHWRERRGLAKKVLAERMGYDRTYVSHIESGTLRPTAEFTRQADTALETGGALWDIWQDRSPDRSEGSPPAPPRDLRTSDFVAWLTDHSEPGFQECYEAVSAGAATLDAEAPAVRHAREHSRRRITRGQLADAVLGYYGTTTGAGAFYRASVDGIDSPVSLSILAQPSWLDVARGAPELGGSHEDFRFVSPPVEPPLRLTRAGWNAAVGRLASAETTDTVMVNNPLYRLLDVTFEPERIAGTFALTDFATYALTADLLERELLDAIARGDEPPAVDRLALRDAYLPTVAAAFDLDRRHCVGGPVSLLAIARLDKEHPGRRDYLLLVQERSSAVLNVTGRLAVIPKAFHQPTSDQRSEVPVSATLRRELEEELLGRQDLEGASSAGYRQVDPFHSERLSPAMSWLVDRQGTDAFRMERTGFGFNMVTGNYEFSCLIVIDDTSWWDTFGHQVEANWEAMRVHRYSSLDTEGLSNLIADPRWSNEGLFAFLQGLRRLSHLDTGEWVAAPAISLEA